MYMSDLFTSLKEQMKGKNLRIVFPEGLDERIIAATGRLAKEQLLVPILIGNKGEIEGKFQQLNVSLEGIEIYDPNDYSEMDELVKAFVERRKGKVSEEDAKNILKDENYFGTMLVYTKKAEG